jgi:hypothetical protein
MSRWHRTEFDFYPMGAFEPRAFGGMALHGGSKTIQAPPPDPALVEAQVNAMNMQTGVAGQMVGIQRQLLPHQIAQMQLGIKAGEAAYADSREDRTYSLERRGHLTGLQDRMIDEAKTYDSEGKALEMGGRAMADASAVADRSIQAGNRAMARMGVNPNSSKFASTAAPNSLMRASMVASAGESGYRAARDEGRALTDRAANVLAGYPAMGMQTSQNSVANGMAGLSAANMASAGISSGFGNAAGVAGGAASTAGNLWQAQSARQLNATQINNSKDDGLWGAIGTLGGAALRFSDRRLKRNVRKVRDDARGFGWYEFEYLWGGGQRVGVMAQEVHGIIPGAVHEACGFLAVDYSKI